MSILTIVDTDYITLVYDADRKIIQHVIHQPFGGEPLRAAMKAGAEALRKYGACKWLSDDRKMGPLSKEDTEWGFKEWNPRTIAAGWKYWAIVVPEEVEAAGSLSPSIENLYDLGLRVMVFSNREDAAAWLDRQSN